MNVASVVLFLWPQSASAAGLAVDHRPVDCAVAEAHPRLSAAVPTAGSVARARAYFRSEHHREWYYVELKRDGPAFTALLPRPSKTLDAYRYYLEFTGREFDAWRSAEHRTRVVASSAECEPGRVLAAIAANASVVVGAPPGVTALPPGFSTAGVVLAPRTPPAVPAAAAAATHGLPATALLIGGGAAAAGVAVAVKAGGSDPSGSSGGTGSGAASTSPPSTTAPVATLRETFSGTLSFNTWEPHSFTMPVAGTLEASFLSISPPSVVPYFVVYIYDCSGGCVQRISSVFADPFGRPARWDLPAGRHQIMVLHVQPRDFTPAPGIPGSYVVQVAYPASR